MADEIEIRVVKHDGDESNFITLVEFQRLVQVTLPSMPKEAIRRTIFETDHFCIVMVKKSSQTEKVIAGIAYRVWEQRRFVELVYLVVASDEQKGGRGALLMRHFKDEIRNSYQETIMEVLAYADNTAIGFFKRQAFTKDIALDKKIWGGIIKHYYSSILMQATLMKGVVYVKVPEMLRMQREALLATLAARTARSEVVHPPLAQQGITGPIDPMSIPAIRNFAWTGNMDKVSKEVGSRPYYTPLREFLDHLRRNKQSKHFLKPVDIVANPTYPTIIAQPMDFETMREKLDEGLYETPKAFVDDVKLIISNCQKFNQPSSIIHRNSKSIEHAMKAFIKSMPEWTYPINVVE